MRKMLWLACLTSVLLFGAITAAFGTGTEESVGAEATVSTEETTGPEETVAAEETICEELENIVVLIDPTGDKDCNAAAITLCEMIADIHPMGKLKVGIISYGYEDEDKENQYNYQSNAKTGHDGALVHQVAALEPLDASSRETFRQALERVFGKKGVYSPHGQGMLAAVDMLQAAGVPSGKGCVIMISDGIKSSSEWGTEEDCREAAVAVAQKHGWPIFALELTNRNPEENAPRSMMEKVAADTVPQGKGNGADTVGHWEISGRSIDTELPRAQTLALEMQRTLQEILYGNTWDETVENGCITVPVTVPNFSGEYVVIFSGVGLEDVKVEPEAPYSQDAVQDLVQITERETYAVVRMPMPMPGDWKVTARSRDGETVFVSREVVRAVSMELQILDVGKNNAVVEQSEAIGEGLDKDMMIRLRAVCSSNGQPININETDSPVSAVLEIRHGASFIKTLVKQECSIDDEGNIDVNLRLRTLMDAEPGKKTGKYQAYIVLVDGKTEICKSNKVELHVKRSPSVLVVTGTQEFSCEAGGTITIPVKDYIQCDEDRPMTYTLLSDDLGEARFWFVDDEGNECSERTGYFTELKIKGVTHVGKYMEVLQIKDGPQEYEVELDIQILSSIKDVEFAAEVNGSLWGRKHEVPMPDGVRSVTVKEGYDSDVVSYFYDHDRNILVITGEKSGNTVLQLVLEYESRMMNELGVDVPETSESSCQVEVQSMWLAWLCFGVVVFLSVVCFAVWIIRRLRKCVIEGTYDYRFIFRESGKQHTVCDSKQFAVNSLLDSVSMFTLVSDCAKKVLMLNTPQHISPEDKAAFRKMMEPLKDENEWPDWLKEARIGAARKDRHSYRIKKGRIDWPKGAVLVQDGQKKELEVTAKRWEISYGETLVLKLLEDGSLIFEIGHKKQTN